MGCTVARFRRATVGKAVFRSICVLLVTSLFLVATFVAPPAHSARAAETPAPPDVTAKALYALDIDANVELYEKDPDAQFEPASTTKIVTALLLVRNIADLSQSVTIEAEDMNAEGESTMALQAGDVV